METVSTVAEQMAASVRDVTTTVEGVRRSAEENEHVVAMMASKVDRVSSALTGVAAITQQASAGAEEMSAAAEEVAASAQSVSAAVEQQTASIEEVNASANELQQMAKRLDALVGEFRMEAEPQEQSRSLRPPTVSRRKAA